MTALAEVIRLPVTYQEDPEPTQPPLRLVMPKDAETSRTRQTRNGHSADCPYPKANPRFCGICAGERKGVQ